MMAISDVEILAVSFFTLFLMYSPDDTCVYGSRGGEFEGIGSKPVVESCKIVFLGVTF